MIIIVGAPRSGTTMLGKIFSSSSNVCYVEEPNVIWRYRNWGRLGHEQFSKSDATEKSKNYIRNFFSKFPGVVVEKTPANALRLDFVKEIFPEAKFIFIYRKPHDVVNSMKRKWLYEYDNNALVSGRQNNFRQLRIQIKRFFKIPILDLPNYFTVVMSELAFHFFKKNRKFWGPQYKGYRTDTMIYDKEYICYKLWTILTQNMINAKKTLHKNQCLELSYDDFVENTESNINRLKQFCEVEDLRSPKKLQKKKNNSTLTTGYVFEDNDLQDSYEKSCLYIADLEISLKGKKH